MMILRIHNTDKYKIYIELKKGVTDNALGLSAILKRQNICFPLIDAYRKTRQDKKKCNIFFNNLFSATR